jgi:hypothetical protein
MFVDDTKLFSSVIDLDHQVRLQTDYKIHFSRLLHGKWVLTVTNVQFFIMAKLTSIACNGVHLEWLTAE